MIIVPSSCSRRIFILCIYSCFIMIPQFLAKHVFGMDDFLYSNDPDAKAVIEVQTTSGGYFETSTKHRIVEFYSPYCGHCISFKKSYVKIASNIVQKYGAAEVEFYAVSCVGVSDLCSKYSIRSYPTIYAIPAGSTMKDRTEILSRNFSVEKIEHVLNLLATSVESQRRVQQVSNDAGEKNTDDENGDIAQEDTDDKSDNEAEKNMDDGTDENGRSNENEEIEEEEKEEAEEIRTGDDDTHNGVQKKNNDDENEQDEEEDSEDTDGHHTADAEFESWKGHAEAILMKQKVGAEYAQELPKTMDQWKDIIKQRLREREYKWIKQKKAKPGSLGTDFVENSARNSTTSIMLANRVGTEAYNQRQKDMMLVIERMRGYARRKNKRKSHDISNQKQHGPGRLPFKKQVSSDRMVESIPIIKRVVHMSSEEALILDASLSFMEGLRVGVYKSDVPLSPKQMRALKDWLDLLSISLPPEWALHEVIGDLKENIDAISKGRKELLHVLEKHKLPRRKWSKSCSHENDFTCGFWKLLHTMTVGVAAFRGGQDLITSGTYPLETRVFAPLDAADTIREYMAYFFTCDDCSNHFIGQYDQCEMNRRCSRLTKDTLTATDADWKELGKWLWEVHNDVNVRLLNEKHDTKRKKRQKSILSKTPAGPGIATRNDQVQVLWPTLRDCYRCFNEDGSFNEDEIFLHLEESYWPGQDLTDTPRGLILFDDDGQGALGLNMIFLILGLFLVAFCQKRVTRASFAETMLQAHALKTRVAAGGKLRTI